MIEKSFLFEHVFGQKDGTISILDNFILIYNKIPDIRGLMVRYWNWNQNRSNNQIYPMISGKESDADLLIYKLNEKIETDSECKKQWESYVVEGKLE